MLFSSFYGYLTVITFSPTIYPFEAEEMIHTRDHKTAYIFDPWHFLGEKMRTDEETVSQLAFNLQWHYALDIVEESDEPPCSDRSKFPSLYYFDETDGR